MKSFLITLCLLFISYISFCQVTVKDTFLLSNKGKKVIIPFKSVNNLIIVPISINGSTPFNFIMDSGVKTTIIMALEPQESMLINNAKKIKVHGLGKGEGMNAYYSVGNQLIVGQKIEGENQELVVLLDDAFHLKSQLGIPIHGIIGFDLLKNFTTKVDYINHNLTFYPKGKFFYKKRMGKRIPIKIFNRKPYINAEVVECTDSLTQVKLLIDTGGNMPIWLLADKKKICIPTKTIENKLGVGLNGDVEGKTGRIKQLKIGPYKLKNPICSFPDSASVYRVVTIDKRNGSIGVETLRRFTFYLDYINSQLIFKPNSYFKDAFTYDMSGITIGKPYPKLPIFIINHIKKDSPAEKAGIKEGDQILYLNGNRSVKLNMEEIYYLLRSRDNKRITLIVLRKAKELKFTFRLKKIL